MNGKLWLWDSLNYQKKQKILEGLRIDVKERFDNRLHDVIEPEI